MLTWRRAVTLSLVVILAVAAGAAAQTTGGIVGRVADEDGGGVPGVIAWCLDHQENTGATPGAVRREE